MKAIWNQLRRIAGNNRGSGIVMVLVCMLCVALMGSTVLFMSYTGLRIKVAERHAREDFYDATTAMDEIRAGLQQAVSDSIAAAYKTVLIHYNDADYIGGADMADKFQEEFREKLCAWEYNTKVLSVSGSSNGGVYNLDLLKSFVSDPSHTVVESTDATPSWIYSASTEQFILQGLQVTYTNPSNNYDTIVKSDIVIGMPDFSYMKTEFSVSNLPDYVIIADNTLTQTDGRTESTISGSAYAGKVQLGVASPGSLALNSGSLICANDILLAGAGSDDSARFSVAEGAEVWANRITVNTGSSVALLGSAFVQDDLDLFGSGASATLGGNYFGFGNDDRNASRSSAILINGMGTTLDISGLQQLMLAGHAFISDSMKTPSDATGDSHYMMGESLTVRRNQQAYLVPAEYLADSLNAPTNPTVYEAANTPDGELNSDQLTEAGRAAASTYGFRVIPMSLPVPGASQSITYFFMSFTDSTKANNYFRDYFNANTAKINAYLNSYTTLSGALGTTSTAGYTLKKVSGEGASSEYALVAPSRIGSTAAQLQSSFERLRQTLSTTRTAAAGTTPYRYYVKTDAVDALPAAADTPVYFGEKTACVINNRGGTTFVVDNSADKTALSVVIASGDVKVERDFSGLIIAGGNVQLAGIRAESNYANVSAVLFSYDDDTGSQQLGTVYLRDGVINSSNSGSRPEEDSGWNLNKLVSYRYWTKN